MFWKEVDQCSFQDYQLLMGEVNQLGNWGFPESRTLLWTSFQLLSTTLSLSTYGRGGLPKAAKLCWLGSQGMGQSDHGDEVDCEAQLYLHDNSERARRPRPASTKFWPRSQTQSSSKSNPEGMHKVRMGLRQWRSGNRRSWIQEV